MEDTEPETKRARFRSPTPTSCETVSNPGPEASSTSKVQLPNELIEVIMEHVKEDGDFGSLANVARASHNMYDIVIPKLYETVTVTKRNHNKIAFGHTPAYGNQDSVMKTLERKPSRKDTATTFTRELVLRSVPNQNLPEHYSAVTTVTVMAETFNTVHTTEYWAPKSVFVTLGRIAKGTTSSTPLHIVFDGRNSKIRHPFDKVLQYLLQIPIPATQEHFTSCMNDFQALLYAAHRMRAIVHCPPRLEYSHYGSGLDHVAAHLFFTLSRGLKYSPSGKLFLCGVFEYVLSRKKLVEDRDKANDIAEDEVYRQLFSFAQKRQHQIITLDQFRAHVQLVEPGFRPPLADKITP